MRECAVENGPSQFEVVLKHAEALKVLYACTFVRS